MFSLSRLSHLSHFLPPRDDDRPRAGEKGGRSCEGWRYPWPSWCSGLHVLWQQRFGESRINESVGRFYIFCRNPTERCQESLLNPPNTLRLSNQFDSEGAERGFHVSCEGLFQHVALQSISEGRLYQILTKRPLSSLPGKQFAALQLQNLATVWRKHALDDLMKEEDVKKREGQEMRPQALE